eukprot:54335-Karenia_brevis.AAC.1
MDATANVIAPIVKIVELAKEQGERKANVHCSAPLFSSPFLLRALKSSGSPKLDVCDILEPM